MKRNNKKGLTILIIALSVVLCISYYVISLSKSMAVSRKRFVQTLNSRQAYYMARSGVEHFILKFDTMKKHKEQSILTLKNASNDEKKQIYSAFLDDVIIPSDDDYTGEKYNYKIDDFKIETNESNSSNIILDLNVSGKYGGYKNTICRHINISH